MANPFDQFDTPAPAAPVFATEGNPFDQFDRGIATTLVGYISQSMASLATAPFRILHTAAESSRAQREAGNDVSKVIPGFGFAEAVDPYVPEAWRKGGPWLEQPEPQTTGEKFAAGVGTGIGAAIAPELGLVAAGPKLAATAVPATAGVIRRTARDIGQFYAEKPGVAFTTGIAAGGVSGAGGEAAKEAGLGPGYQIAASMAAPAAVVGPLALGSKGFQAAEYVSSRLGVPTLTPSASIAGWEAGGGPWRKVVTSPFSSAKAAGNWLNDLILAPSETLSRSEQSAQRILRRIGLPMSADVPPTATPTLGAPEPLAEVNARAYQMLANQLMRGGGTPDDIVTVFNNFARYRRLHSSGLAQNTLFLADIPPFTSMAGAIARTTTNRLPLEAVVGRQTGITPETTTAEQLAERTGIPTGGRFEAPMTGAQAERRFGRRFDTPKQSIVPRGQLQTVEDAFRRVLLIESQPHHGHQVSGLRTIERMAADRELESGPAYDKTYAAGWHPDGSEVDFRPRLAPLLDAYEAAIAQEQESVANAIRKGIAMFRRALEATPYEPAPSAPRISLPRQNMIERLDRAKRAFDESVINPMFKPGEKSPWTAGVVNKFKQDVLGVIDTEPTNDVGTLYKEARDIWASRSETIDDIRLGMDAWKADSEIGADVMEGASPNVRLGLFEGFRLQALRLGTGADVSKLFDNHRIMQIIAAAIPKSQKAGAVFADRPTRFGGYVNMQQAQVRTLTEIARGSPTAARTQAMQDLADMHTIVEAATKKGWKGIAMDIASAALQKMFGYRANTSDALARMLFTANRAEIQATIEGIRQHMGPDRFSYFTRLMAQMLSEGVPARGVVPGAAVVTQPQSNQ